MERLRRSQPGGGGQGAQVWGGQGTQVWGGQGAQVWGGQGAQVWGGQGTQVHVDAMLSNTPEERKINSSPSTPTLRASW